MATIKTHEASPSTSRWSHEAYLSSSGGGTTRRQFTEPLYEALKSEGLYAFRDDDELRRGEDIMLKKVIEGSKVSIIVLSQKYASSRSRLDDLVMILKCRSSGHLVLPVFYGVDPSEVRTQTGSLEAVFRMHEQKGELKGKVQGWRMALKKVADLADLAGLTFATDILETDGSNIIHRVCVKVNEYVKRNNRAHPGRQDRRESRASRLEDERARGKRSKDNLQQLFGKKRKDAAKSMGMSVSTLKRDCRYHGIPRWPNNAAPNQPLATMPTVPDIIPHLTGGSSEFSGCPNLSGIADPHPQIASTQIPSENMRNLEYWTTFFSEDEPSMEEYGSGLWDPAPSQQLMMPPLIASQDTSSVMVKATYGHTKIRFKLSFASGIVQLNEEVSKRLEFEPGSFNLECDAADGDYILIACDDDVRQYLQLVTLWGNQVIKLYVLDKVLNTTKLWDNCGCDYCKLLRWKIPTYV